MNEGKKKSMIIYYDDLTNYKDLTDSEYGRLIRAALRYDKDGTEPKLTDRTLRMAFQQMKIRQDLNRAKYDAISKIRSEAGKKGGAPKGNRNATRPDERERTAEEWDALESDLINKSSSTERDKK